VKSVLAHAGVAKASYTNPIAGLTTRERFSNMAGDFQLSAEGVDRLGAAAKDVARQLVPALQAKAACLGNPDAACLKPVLEGIGLRAFRRPLAAEELTRLTQLVTGNLALGAPTAVGLAIRALLVSPHFLLRQELGAGPVENGRRRLSSYELASALAFTLTDAPPDDTLLMLAASNGLATSADVAAQVGRLLKGAGESPTAARFAREFFRYSQTERIFKDPRDYPFHSPNNLIQETDLWMKELLGGKDFLRNVLTANTAYVRKSGAPSYNLEPATVTSTTPTKVTLPAIQRAGILTQPSFLSAFSESESNDVINRGRFIAQSLLCLALPDTAPENVPPLREDPKATMRELLAVHRTSVPSCKACHDLMDPLGLGLEAFDHVGRFRTTEQGRPVDATGILMATGNADGPFDGAVQLAQRLAGSPTVEGCFVRHGFRFWFGRDEVRGDACVLAKGLAASRAAGGELTALIAAFVTSDAFLYRSSL
jgi:hypothetical protein